MTAKTREKRRAATHQALGAYEAAAVMGVHFSTPARMVEKGLISGRLVPSSGPLKSVGIYDGASCEANFEDYDAQVLEHGGTGRRPRSWLHLRPEALKRLAACPRIDFADAITTAEAAEILSVHNSFIVRMIAAGEIVGRRLWSKRTAGGPRVYIVSRQSCVENAQKVRRLQATGSKNGRPRKFS